MTQDRPAAPTPVTILTGFLGAGKTTLLNRIVRADHGLRIAVMVNDFGAINIDNELVVGVEDGAVNLANGCICCTIRDDLLEATFALLNRPKPPQYLLIEASGVSDPVAIAATFLLPELRPLVTLDSVITLVDAEQVRAQRSQIGGLIEEQIYAADLVVLNKIDLVDDAQRNVLKTWIRSLAPRARIFEASHADVPLELLLGVGRYRLHLEPAVLQGQPHQHEHNHAEAFSSWSYTSDTPLALRQAREVLKELPPTVVRAKGILLTTEAPERRVVFHLVGRRVMFTVGEPWGTLRPQTQLVAIGTPGGIDGATLATQLAACQQPPDTAP